MKRIKDSDLQDILQKRPWDNMALDLKDARNMLKHEKQKSKTLETALLEALKNMTGCPPSSNGKCKKPDLACNECWIKEYFTKVVNK